LAAAVALGASSGWSADVIAAVSVHSAPVDFALGRLEAALAAHGESRLRQTSVPSEAALVVEVGNRELGPDGFSLAWRGETLVVAGGDARGAMYGVLDVADQLRFGTTLREIAPRTVRARFPFRAIKFNLPFAAYRDGPYLRQHEATCKDIKFWEAFLDMMAENRFNTLTLWSLHPFPYLIVPRDFPEARMFSNAEMGEWRRLWSGVFRLAKERGIETYLVNWNTFVSPAFADAHHVATYSKGGTHIGPGAKETIVADYMRECVTQVINEYPDLSGLGITLGERMGGQSPDERRDWLGKTFYDGIAAAGRPIKFFYRAPLSATTDAGGSTSAENDLATRVQIESRRDNISGPVYVDFKHNASHGHSSPDLFIVHGGKLSDVYGNPPPTAYQVVWTMRNEDFIILRWGQPDFVRQFARANPARYVAGAVIGSETYIPALDYISADGPGKTGQYAFERQWLFYAVWGLLLHEPTLPDSRFAAMLAARFGRGTGNDLLEAWKLASAVPLRFASFYQGTWDGSLYTEGFSTWTDYGARKLIDVNAFIAHPVLDTNRYINIADYVKSGGHVPTGVTSPPALAELLDRDCGEAMNRISAVRARGEVSPALERELTDLEAWCAYGNYFAHKLRAGTALATARMNHNESDQRRAVAALRLALEDWRRLAALGAKYNRLPVLSPARDPFSWDALTPEVIRDIELAQAPL